MQEQQKVAKKLDLKSDQHHLDYQIKSATVTFVNKVPPEVEFVTPVTPGWSVKFLPAV